MVTHYISTTDASGLLYSGINLPNNNMVRLFLMRSCHSSIIIYTLFPFFRLARGSILASVIRIMLDGPLRVMALYVSGLFVVFYVVMFTQFISVCQRSIKPNSSEYVLVFGFHFVSASPFYEWSSFSIPQCNYQKQIVILQMTGQSLSDDPPPHFLLLNLI